MTVNLSALAGAGQQFFNDGGVPLSGGKLYSYAAGTTTPQATYTSASGSTAHTNPIVLDSAGRVATGEIWLTAGSNYKFALYTITDVLIATWDNITGINGTGITSNASNVQYDPAGTGAVSTTVQAKLRQYLNVFDFMTTAQIADVQTNTASINVTTPIQTAYTAANAANKTLYIPAGSYLVSGLVFDQAINVLGESELTRFLASTNNITIVKFANIDKTPGKSYLFTAKDFVVWANGKTGCIGLQSYRGIGCYYENISVDSCDQGFRLEGDQYCQYTNIRARNCVIGVRLVDDTISATGGANNNQFNSPVVSVCQVAYMCGRPTAPFPLHTVTFINAVALGSSFSSYVSYNYTGLTFTNCSPESTITATTPTTYDGCTVKPGLGYFYSTQATIRDSQSATNGQAFILETNSVVTFDNFAGATCSVTADATSFSNFINGLNGGNGTNITTNSVSLLVPAGGRTTSYQFPHEAQFAANLINHCNDPITTLNSVDISASVTAATAWNSALGICGSFFINDGSTNKGLSPRCDGTAYSTNSIFLVGVSLVSSVNCSISIGVTAQILAPFNLTANIPVRCYVVGGGSSSGTFANLSINILDNSGATVYFGKVQANVSSDVNYKALMSQIMRNHLYNSKRSQGDVSVLAASPTIGTWRVGDVVYTYAPASGGYIGWVCTVAGTSGTWKTYGLIS